MSDEIPISPLAPTVSPLIEADPSSINELITERIDDVFNTPPLMKKADGTWLLDDDKLRVAVAYYRKERVRFMNESAAKALKEPKPRRKTPASVAEALATPMEDLL